MNLADRQREFMGFLDMIDSPTEDKSIRVRDFVIGTVGVLMQEASVPLPAIVRSLKALARRSDKQLTEDSVAIVNGSALLLPKEDGVEIINLTTLSVMTTLPAAVVTTIYSPSHLWGEVEKILK
jgi:hypothetical protein